MTTTCTCGTAEAHEVARRRTADGTEVVLWSDGTVTGAMGCGLFGGAPRKPSNVAAYMRAGWLAMGEVCLYEEAELRGLIRRARSAVRQASMEPLTYLRRKMAGLSVRSQRASRGRRCGCRYGVSGWALCPSCFRRQYKADFS